MIAYKMFNPDLTCTMGSGIFTYEPGRWYEEGEANIAQNGFHCCENPLDCLSYYPWDGNNRMFAVIADGDINDDGRKVSCTKIYLLKELDLQEMLSAALDYASRHLHAGLNHLFHADYGTADLLFTLVHGIHPLAKGRAGAWLGFLDDITGEIGLWHVGEDGVLSDVWYDMNGNPLGDDPGKAEDAAPETSKTFYGMYS